MNPPGGSAARWSFVGEPARGFVPSPQGRAPGRRLSFESGLSLTLVTLRVYRRVGKAKVLWRSPDADRGQDEYRGRCDGEQRDVPGGSYVGALDDRVNEAGQPGQDGESVDLPPLGPADAVANIERQTEKMGAQPATIPSMVASRL